MCIFYELWRWQELFKSVIIACNFFQNTTMSIDFTFSDILSFDFFFFTHSLTLSLFLSPGFDVTPEFHATWASTHDL